MIRTTVNIPDDVFAVVQSLSWQRNISLGEALAELVRRALNSEPRVDKSSEFPCFRVPPDAQPITLAQTLAAEDEL